MGRTGGLVVVAARRTPGPTPDPLHAGTLDCGVLVDFDGARITRGTRDRRPHTGADGQSAVEADRQARKPAARVDRASGVARNQVQTSRLLAASALRPRARVVRTWPGEWAGDLVTRPLHAHIDAAIVGRRRAIRVDAATRIAARRPRVAPGAARRARHGRTAAPASTTGAGLTLRSRRPLLPRGPRRTCNRLRGAARRDGCTNEHQGR